MNVFASIGRRGVSMGSALALCALLAVSTQAMAVVPAAVVLPAMDAAAPQVAVAAVTAVALAGHASVKPPIVVSEAATALLLKQQASGAVAMPDDRDVAFPRAWMLGLLAVLALVLFDRIRLSMKLAKLDQDALRSSGLSAPFARN